MAPSARTSAVTLRSASHRREPGRTRPRSISAAKATGGRYESIAATTRLQTLLPEIGGLIDEADQRQRAQYRVTFERPEGKSGPQVGGIGLSSDKPMAVKLSIDGHMP